MLGRSRVPRRESVLLDGAEKPHLLGPDTDGEPRFCPSPRERRRRPVRKRTVSSDSTVPARRLEMPRKPATNAVRGGLVQLGQVPSCSILPACMTAIMSAIVMASRFLVVRDVHERDADLVLDPLELELHLLAELEVERAERLVEERRARAAVDERASQGDAAAGRPRAGAACAARSPPGRRASWPRRHARSARPRASRGGAGRTRRSRCSRCGKSA